MTTVRSPLGLDQALCACFYTRDPLFVPELVYMNDASLDRGRKDVLGIAGPTSMRYPLAKRGSGFGSGKDSRCFGRLADGPCVGDFQAIGTTDDKDVVEGIENKVGAGAEVDEIPGLLVYFCEVHLGKLSLHNTIFVISTPLRW